jgi:hypothetical protein
MQFLVTSLLALVAGTAAFAPSPRAFVVVRNAGNGEIEFNNAFSLRIF